MNFKKIAVGLSLSCIVATAQAQETDKTPGAGPNPFSDCGIGAALFPNHPVGAVISNVIWDIGTTAVTSATASPETCNGKNVKAAAFIMESYDQLLEETAKGQGQHIVSMFDILETPQSEREDAIEAVRLELAKTLSAETYNSLDKTQKASAYYDSVMSAIDA